jgi:hypothetical protein
MVELINRATKTRMRVAEDRVEEYLAAGHTLAAAPKPEAVAPKVEEKPKDEPTEEPTEEKPKAKKTTRKK